MCGRFVGFRKIDALMEHFPIDVSDVEITANFNVAPTQEILVIIRHHGKNHLERLHWGLVPFWSKETAIGSRLINARAETAASKPSFRQAFRKRRCLILADGFYEWKRERGGKQPMFLTLPGGDPFAFAGLWESWDDRGRCNPPYRSATILTRAASPSVMPIHHRMPVILKPAAYGAWLDPEHQDVAALQTLIEEQIVTDLTGIPVSKRVNSPTANSPDNLRPVGTD